MAIVELLMACCGPIINPIAQTVLVPVTDHAQYIVSCRKYVRDMQTKMGELDTAIIDVEAHIGRNKRNHLQIPSQVGDWLDKVEGIKANVEKNFPSDVISCCSLRIRHKLGQKAFMITTQIESLMRELALISWIDDPVPLGRVGSMNASTSAPSSDHHDVFPSREQIFREALEALEPIQKSHMIALWGMGGVGKTTMMKKLREVVEQKKMFNIIVQVIIGEKTNPIAIQQAVADYLSIEMKENTKEARADRLRKWFEADGGKSKFLVILDDVWEFVDLQDIGLSPLPNKGVNFKVLLTSRDSHVCTLMGAEANSILNIKVLTDVEGQSLFRQFAKNAGDADLDPAFHGIADSIASRCQGLPIAIKTIALSLQGRRKYAWDDALSRLENHKIHKEVVREVFKISYENLKEEDTKSIFLLCALFPEDFDIPTEELVRYGWGLKLFTEAKTIREARNRLNTCTERLRETNLLLESDDIGCVKMHDLVRAFVLHMFSEVEHASIVNHGSMLGWPEENYINESCKRISLTCKGMSEFPKDLKFPNLSILKLMHGDKSLRFSENFYGKMEKVQVISYDEMKYPLLPSSPQCSSNLRVLHLHQCSLRMFDCSSIGYLLNMEVLSFANSGIEWLPSTIGNLKKLRLLDLTDCAGLRIDNGVLKNLVKLEELYLGVNRSNGKSISLTDENCNEMAKGLKKLSALEFQFFGNSAQPKNISFENLERFKISVGCSLDGYFSKSRHSYENTLKLIIDKGELLESRMNELFEKTEVLCLSVGDMNTLSDVEVKSSSFYNLRVLVVAKCAELKHLFTLGVANTLSKLEHLEVYKCDNMEELIHTGGSEGDTITFPKLKLLSLHGLPKLLGLCLNVNTIELPELVELKLDSIPGFTSIYPKNKLEASSLLKEEVVIPKLETLQIYDMENLKEIWPCELSRGEKVKLREIVVYNCKKLVNLFPHNPMSLLHHLEELKVMNCGSIESLFNIDLDCAGAIGEEDNISSLIRSIEVHDSGKLRELWRIKGADNSHPLVRGFQAVESIRVRSCKRFRNVFTPTTTNFDLGALLEISISECGENRGNDKSEESSQEEEEEQTDILSEEETLQEVTDTNISNVVFPSGLIHSFHNLRRVKLKKYQGVEVVFEIESPTSRELVTTHHNQQQPILPNLQELVLSEMDNMIHVWKCINWNKFFTLPKQQSESPFHNLTTIHIVDCKSIKYLFSPLMAELLSNLKKVEIEDCDGIEEVVSNREDEDEEMTTSTHTSTTLFPRLDSLTLCRLNNLKCIGGGGAKDESKEISFNNTTTTTDQFEVSEAGGVSWSLCQYSREIRIEYCPALSSVIPCYAAGQMQKLQVLRIWWCDGMKEVFETQLGTSSNKNNKSGCDEGIPRLNNNVIMLPNLKKLKISFCSGLEHIFTFSALESLRQLEELTIKDCEAMKVIVKKEEEDASSSSSSSSKKVVVFPHLKSIKLDDLPELEGFFLGMNEFQWRSLDNLIIKKCPKLMVFAAGGSTAPQLKYIHTGLGKHTLDQESGLNFHQTPSPSSHGATTYPATSDGMPWSFHNLIELVVELNGDVKKIIPSSELLQMQKLEKIHVRYCDEVEEVFEAAMEAAGRNRNSSSGSGFDESSQATTTTTLVNLPNLTQVELESLHGLRYIWKSNQWTVFQFPNVTRVDINCCNRLEHVFTSSMVGSLLQLQELSIKNCSQMEEVIVKDADVVEEDKEKESDGKTNKEILVLPRLKSLILQSLRSLKGFSLGKDDFSFPLLDTLEIKRCPAITTFTKGNSATPQLKEIEINLESFYAAGEKDINSFVNIKQEEFKKTLINVK